MHSEPLNKSEWKDYFSGLSTKISAASLVEIEVQALATTDELETEWVKLNGITYDPKDDELSVFCENIDHMIRHPREISINKDPEGVTSCEVDAEDGYRHVIKFEPPMKI